MIERADICPRCRTATVSTVASSPVPGHWEMYSCSTCWYAWRSTEGPAATDPEHYPDRFRISPADIANAIRIV